MKNAPKFYCNEYEMCSLSILSFEGIDCWPATSFLKGRGSFKTHMILQENTGNNLSGSHLSLAVVILCSVIIFGLLLSGMLLSNWKELVAH